MSKPVSKESILSVLIVWPVCAGWFRHHVVQWAHDARQGAATTVMIHIETCMSCICSCLCFPVRAFCKFVKDLLHSFCVVFARHSRMALVVHLYPRRMLQPIKCVIGCSPQSYRGQAIVARRCPGTAFFLGAATQNIVPS